MQSGSIELLSAFADRDECLLSVLTWSVCFPTEPQIPPGLGTSTAGSVSWHRTFKQSGTRRDSRKGC